MGINDGYGCCVLLVHTYSGTTRPLFSPKAKLFQEAKFFIIIFTYPYRSKMAISTLWPFWTYG